MSSNKHANTTSPYFPSTTNNHNPFIAPTNVPHVTQMQEEIPMELITRAITMREYGRSAPVVNTPPSLQQYNDDTFNKQIPATATVPTDHVATSIGVLSVKGSSEAATSEISAKTKHNGTKNFDLNSKTKERRLDHATPVTTILNFLCDDAINDRFNCSNGKVSAIDITVRSALNNSTDEKNSILYSIQRSDFCFPSPSQSFSTGRWEVDYGRGVVATSWGSGYVSNLPKTFDSFKPEAESEII